MGTWGAMMALMTLTHFRQRTKWESTTWLFSCRMVLICWLAIAMGGVIVHEQAASSLMLEHDRWKLLRSLVRVTWVNSRLFSTLLS